MGQEKVPPGDLDFKRQETAAYQYLCHLEEVRRWISDCIEEELPPATELEENLRNGVYLAKIAHFCAPNLFPVSRIFDADQRRWREQGLHFRHTENINLFLQAARAVGLPEIFLTETTDIYDRKNMPRAVFCIHALSLKMYRNGSAPMIQDLYGRAQFTEAEISLMQEELTRTGVELPEFRSLGGMLADEGSGGGRKDRLKAAFEELALRVQQEDCPGLLAVLTSPAAKLEGVEPGYISHYMLVLSAESRGRTRPLSQPEVQGLVMRVNLLLSLEAVLAAVRAEDPVTLLAALRCRHLALPPALLLPANIELYLTNLLDCAEGLEPDTGVLKKDMILAALVSANQLAREKNSTEAAIAAVNVALRNEDCDELVAALRHPALRLPEVHPEAAHLYLAELLIIQQETGSDLSYDSISRPVAFLNLVARVGLAADRRAGDGNNTAAVMAALSAPELAILDLDASLGARYASAIVRAVANSGTIPTHTALQDLVDGVNADAAEDLRRVEAVERVNVLVEEGGEAGGALCQALSALGLRLGRSDERRCLDELLAIRANRSRAEGQDMQLWIQDIEEAVELTRSRAAEAVSVAGALRGLNSAVEYGDAIGVMSYLANNWELFGLQSRPDRKKGEEILKALQRRRVGKPKSGHNWVRHYFQDGSTVYIEVESGRYSWLHPAGANQLLLELRRSSALDVGEVVEAVEEVEGGEARQLERLMVGLQARARGYLVRKKLFDMLDWYDTHQREVILVQALWRGKLARRQYIARLSTEIRRRQSVLRYMYSRGEDLRRLERSALVIQRAWRARKLRQEWSRLLTSGKADLHTVVAHIHLLDIRVSDAQEELTVARARGELSRLMRQNDSLEQELEEMDKKIGLLVHNRISVQDVIADRKKGHLTLTRTPHNHKKSDSSLGGTSNVGTHRGLKALKKESQDRLKAYQHLFYLLQTDPDYLARLMFTVPQPNTKFMESLIFTLYNFGSNHREEFLLIKLFRTALQREIDSKVQKLDDVVRNTPLVLKLVVTYNRSGRGGYLLKQLLGPLVTQVLGDASLKINVNPIEVYKSWVNQTESETGQAAGLPYDVTQEVALNYGEVQKRLERSISNLKRMSTLFLATITGGLHKLPYGILYLAKVLFNALAAKFPEAQEKEILKVVGNLVYYKFINPAIIAPDRFDMVDKKTESGNLNNDQRRNLAHIAKILQFAASKKGFANESPHLEALNPFIIDCHEKFKQFFVECCQVAEPEDQFNIDQYSEASLIAKPNIYISLSEICDTHQLLVDHQRTVAPEPCDPILPLLEALGPPSLSSLLGAAEGDCPSLSSLGKTEVCLILSPAPGSGWNRSRDMSDAERLWVKTKHLLLAILPAVQHSEKQTLIGILKSRTTPAQEDAYNAILDRRELEGEASKHQDIEVFNIFADEEGRLPLEDAKRLVLKNLRILELEGFTSSKDGCQSIVTDIAKDILNQREHRVNRRREWTRLKRTKASLINKQDYMKAQLDQYRQYVNHCLANLNRAGTANKRVHFATLQDGDKGRKMRSKAALKYAATKLHEKGVLLTIQGLPPAQLKNVMFVFLPLEADGLFEISARFMGVDMERVVIDIQELLKLQYEGVAVTDMFGAAKINVNLLLHFLNAKFYGK